MRYSQKLLWLAGFISIIFVVFSHALLAHQNELLYGDDLHLTYYFFRQYIAQSIHAGIFPWWNPYLFSGQPFAAHPQAFLPFYLPHWLFVLFPVAPTFSWFLAGHVLLAMTGMYWMMRRWVGGMAAWSSGVVFGLSGYFMARIWAGHVDVVAASAWVPWVFGAFWIAMQSPKPRYIVLAGFLLAVQLFAGYQSVALFTMEAVGIAMIGVVMSKKSLRPVGIVFAGVVIALGLTAVQLLPEQEFARLSIRSYALPYDWSSGFALTGNLLKLLINPFIFGDQHTYAGPWPNLAEYLMFIGKIPLVLLVAFLGLIFIKREKRYSVWICIAVMVWSLWIAFANNAPVDLLKIIWTLFPPYHIFRLPSRHLILFVFAAGALVGFAINGIKHRLLQSAIVLAIVIELVPFAQHFIEVKPVPESGFDPKLVSMFKGDATPYRILPNFGVWLSPRESFGFDGPMMYQIFSATGYDPSILRSYYEFIDAANKKIAPSILEHNVQIPYLNLADPYADFLNIKYVLVPTNDYSLAGINTFTLIKEDTQKGYKLYENRAVLPRFFFVPSMRMFADREEERNAIIQGALYPRNEVFIEQSSLQGETLRGQNGCSVEYAKVNIVVYTPNSIELTTASPCDSWLVSSEVLYPGWTAYVDGKQTSIYEGNLAFRTLFVPKGNHTIVFRFLPMIFLYGGLISMLTGLICFSWVRRNTIRDHVSNI